MRTQFFQTTLAVSFGLLAVHLTNQIGVKADISGVQQEGKIQVNIRNLFDSITKNDNRNAGAYRNILEGEAVKQRQAFDAAKEEFRFARENAHKQKNDLKLNGKVDEERPVIKRETKAINESDEEDVPTPAPSDSSESSESDENEPTTTTQMTTKAKRTPETPPPSDTPEEDAYIRHFGMDVYKLTKGWKVMRAWYHEIGEHKMRKVCALGHEKMGYGSDAVVYEPMLNIKELVFTNKAYGRFRFIDVVTYRVEDGTTIYDKRKYYHFTQGVREDCIFYLLPDDSRGRQFKLHKQVCQIKVF